MQSPQRQSSRCVRLAMRTLSMPERLAASQRPRRPRNRMSLVLHEPLLWPANRLDIDVRASSHPRVTACSSA